MEKRLLLHRIEFPVELLVVLLLQVRRLAGPDRVDVVDDVVFVGVDIFSVLPLLFLAEDHFDRHEAAVLGEERTDLVLRSVVACRIIVKIEGDFGTPSCLVALLHLEFRIALAAPADGLRSFLPGKGLDSDLGCDHESGIETKTEMADDVLVLVLLEEFACGREGYLVDVLVDLLFSHADTAVDDLQGFCRLVENDLHVQVTQFALELAIGSEGLHLLGSIHCICDKLPEEYFVIRIEKLLDYRENVLGSHTYLSFVCHDIVCFLS